MSTDSSKAPAAPDYAKLFQQGIDVLLKNEPTMLNSEEQYRQTVDPQRIADQQALQKQFGATQYQQQLDALHQLDPESAKIRADLGKHVQDDLALGYDIPPELARQAEQNLRGAQTARGNAYGTGPALAETFVKAKLGADMYQQRLQNEGSFLSGPTPEQQLLAVQAVQPDRSMAYVNPGAGTAGANFGLANYQNLLAAQTLQQNNNPWTKALSGGAAGAAAGSSFGPYGALIGGVAGGALGYFGSDKNLKSDIRAVGVSPSGIPVVEFRYTNDEQRHTYRGVIAQDVQRIKPDAVLKGADGYLYVNYNKIDVPLCLLS